MQWTACRVQSASIRAREGRLRSGASRAETNCLRQELVNIQTSDDEAMKAPVAPLPLDWSPLRLVEERHHTYAWCDPQPHLSPRPFARQLQAGTVRRRS